MNTQAPGASKGDRKLGNSWDVLASIRDLVVHLHRGNGEQAEVIVTDVTAYLKDVVAKDPASVDQRAQQTIFAIDEVRMLLAARDYKAAASAARDAAREWKPQPSERSE